MLTKLSHIVHFLGITLLLFLANTLYGQEILRLETLEDEIPLKNFAAVLAKSDASLSLQEVSQAEFVALAECDKDDLYAADRKAYWIKFEIQNEEMADRKLYLELEHIDKATLFVPQNSPVKPFAESTNGMLMPISERPVFFGRIPYLPFKVPAKSTLTCYLKIEFETNYSFQNRKYFFRPLENLSLVPAKVQEAEYNQARYFQGFFLGAMLLIALYNLFVFFFVRDTSYVFYTFFIAFLAFFHMIHEGYALEFLWPESPLWDMMSMYNVRALAWIFFTFFTAKFLNLITYARKWRIALWVISTAYILFILTTFFDYWNLYVFHILTFLNILVVLGINIIFVIRRYRPAYFFLVANSFYIVSTLLIQLGVFLNWDLETDILWQIEEIGDVLQALLFSAALADRINLLREKVQEQEQERIEMAEKQRVELEEQVRKRTFELAQAKDNIQSLSQVGRSITAALHKSDVIDTVYRHLQQLMDTSMFGIALINEDKTQLEFKEFLLEGEKQPPTFIGMEEKDRLSLICMEQRKPVFISDYAKEYSEYVSENKGGKFIADRESVIYLPLIQDDEAIGVMTVQSRRKNAYTKSDLSVLQTLATYIIIALDNAQAYNAIEEARLDIARTNQQITDSLRYAQDIQEVILPEPEEMEAMFRDHFIIYRPKDFVSGDFYWVKQDGARTYIAMADCTGHGVPGAFMSMIGTTLLNQILDQTEDCEEILVEILAHLHVGVRKALKQKITGNDDGMDVVLCMLEPAEEEGKTKVSFAGAKRPLYYTHEGELHEIRGTNKTIGGRIKRARKSTRKFEQHDITLNTGDMLYLTTDGYVDQASPEHKKFGSVQFLETLSNIQRLSTADQQAELEKQLDNHQGKEEQRDDISVIGLLM